MVGRKTWSGVLPGILCLPTAGDAWSLIYDTEEEKEGRKGKFGGEEVSSILFLLLLLPLVVQRIFSSLREVPKSLLGGEDGDRDRMEKKKKRLCLQVFGTLLLFSHKPHGKEKEKEKEEEETGGIWSRGGGDEEEREVESISQPSFTQKKTSSRKKNRNRR